MRCSYFIGLVASVTKKRGNRKSAEWKCVYVHWFCACHVCILLVLEGLVTNNALDCKAAVRKRMYFHWFWADTCVFPLVSKVSVAIFVMIPMQNL